MEHFIETQTDLGRGVDGIAIQDIFSIACFNGEIILRDEVDGNTAVTFETPEEFLDMLGEARQFILDNYDLLC